MTKLWPCSNCLNPPAGFFKASSVSVGLTLHGIKSLSSTGSLFLRRGFGRSVRFSSMMMAYQAAAAAVDKEGKEVLLPKNSRDSPCLLVPSGLLVAEGEEEASFVKLTTTKMGEEEEEIDNTTNDDYYDLLSVEGKKLVLKKKIKKNLWLPWQRDLLPVDDAICFGSSHGWLAFIHPRNCSIYLYNPLIIDHSFPYLPLPPIETLPSVISSLRCKRSSCGSIITTEYMVPQKISAVSSEHLSEDFFEKIVFSSPPPSSQLPFNIDDCTVMTIQGYCTSKLAFCRIGDPSWTVLEDEINSDYMDLVYLSEHQLFYGLTIFGIKSWDLRNPASPKSSWIIEYWPVEMTLFNNGVKCIHSRYYLVAEESTGDLLLVYRYCSEAIPTKTIAFDVYKLDFVRKEWVSVPSLGDGVLFVGANHSQSLSAHDFPGLIPNSIYFTDEPVEKHHRGITDLGFFNLEDKTIYRRHLKKKKVQPFTTWIVPHL